MFPGEKKKKNTSFPISNENTNHQLKRKHLCKYSQDRGDPRYENHEGSGCSRNQDYEVGTNSILDGNRLKASEYGQWTTLSKFSNENSFCSQPN